MTVLTTSLDRRSEAFAANSAAMRGLVEDLREKVAAIREGGGEARGAGTSRAAGRCRRERMPPPRTLALNQVC